MMLLFIMGFVLLKTPVQALQSRSGFGEEYANTNYTPLIVETRSMISTQVLSKLTCITICLTQNDCSLAVFSRVTNQCDLYNLFPLAEAELLPDNNMIVFTFELTIQLSPLVSDTNWLLSRMNSTNLVQKIPIPYARSLAMDVFGYILSLEALTPTVYVNRFDRTSLTLVKRTAIPIPYTTVPILTYYNNMIFISGPSNVVFIFDHVNFTLLGNITCGTNLSQPRNLIFMESLNLMIIVSSVNNKIVFFRIHSPTNYTCFNNTPLSGGPQALLKINDTFFYVITYYTLSIYSFQFDGQTWIQSLFTNVSQTAAISNAKATYLSVDNLQRRWILLPGFGLAVYDQWGNYLSKWRFGVNPFDIFIFSDYRIVIAETGNSTISFYDPQVRT